MVGAGWVAIGSAFGGMARYAVSGFVAKHIGETFPWGTVLVNISGALVIGAFAGCVAPSGALEGNFAVRQLVIVGLCGGYTTFSSFSLQTLNLVRDGEWMRAFGNIAISVVACLLAVWAGYALGAFISGG